MVKLKRYFHPQLEKGVFKVFKVLSMCFQGVERCQVKVFSSSISQVSVFSRCFRGVFKAFEGVFKVSRQGVFILH